MMAISGSTSSEASPLTEITGCPSIAAPSPLPRLP
jgi:hypothetical protein